MQQGWNPGPLFLTAVHIPLYYCTHPPFLTQDTTLHSALCIPGRQSTYSNYFLTHFAKMACSSESSVSALSELELSELELELEATSPLDEAPDELLDESAAGALAAMQMSCTALSSPLSSQVCMTRHTHTQSEKGANHNRHSVITASRLNAPPPPGNVVTVISTLATYKKAIPAACWSGQERLSTPRDVACVQGFAQLEQV